VPAGGEAGGSAGVRPRLWWSLLRLARPSQWAKSAFVLVGPFYGLREATASGRSTLEIGLAAVIAAAAFAFASSGCYVVNDLFDREADRAHPRKCRRPLAAGHVSVGQAQAFALVLFVMAAGAVAGLIPMGAERAAWTGATVLLYVGNVGLYSFALKHRVIADVMSLSLGFVLRVMGGCAAAAIEPSVWLLNVVFFLSMFLAFGKRLGERRTLADPDDDADSSRAVEHRRVQAFYTDVLLQMSVVVTGVVTLMTYAFYVQLEAPAAVLGFNLQWLTVIPVTYALFRCIVVIERGQYDDPTELAVHDRPFQAAGVAFVGLTLLLLWMTRAA